MPPLNKHQIPPEKHNVAARRGQEERGLPGKRASFLGTRGGPEISGKFEIR